MPELPEVETVVRSLQPCLLGRRVTHVTLFRSDIVRPACPGIATLLTGQTVQRVGRRGKMILICLDGGCTLVIHLGMTGQLTMEGAIAPVKRHTHLILQLEMRASDEATTSMADKNLRPTSKGGQSKIENRKSKMPFPSPSIANCKSQIANSTQLRFRDPRRFGRVAWLTPTEVADAGLGPEPLALRPAELARRLGRTRRVIKSVLLDQSVIAGLGNIYADESLFLAGVHPLTPANELSLDQIRRLNRAIKLTLRRAILHRGSSLRDYIDVNGASGRYQNLHLVYARSGQPCKNCKTSIQRLVLSGRSACFCPKCQRHA